MKSLLSLLEKCEQGREAAKKGFDESLANALTNGAGPAHKFTAVDHALPQLRLVFEGATKEGKVYTTDPLQVADKHTQS